MNQLKPLSKGVLTDRFKAVLFRGSFLLCVFHVCRIFLSVHCSLVVTCWERADLLDLLCVMFYCVLSLSHVVSWVRCGAGLYLFLIFAFFLTFDCVLLGPEKAVLPRE